MKRTTGLASLAVGLLAGAAWRLYGSRLRGRRPSAEGLDNPEVARAFGRIARLPQMRLLRWFVVRRALSMVRQGEVVDLGCGPGDLALLLSQQAPRLHVTGVDLAEEMLAQARTAALKHGLSDRVSFRIGDAAQIPFPAESLDLVVSTLSLHHWSDPLPVLDEIARVLRPGGAFLVFDLRRDLAAPAWLLLWFATHVVVPRALRHANEPMGSRDAAYTPEEVAHLAAQTQLTGWRITKGPLWLTLEGQMATPSLTPGRASDTARSSPA